MPPLRLLLLLLAVLTGANAECRDPATVNKKQIGNKYCCSKTCCSKSLTGTGCDGPTTRGGPVLPACKGQKRKKCAKTDGCGWTGKKCKPCSSGKVSCERDAPPTCSKYSDCDSKESCKRSKKRCKTKGCKWYNSYKECWEKGEKYGPGEGPYAPKVRMLVESAIQVPINDDELDLE